MIDIAPLGGVKEVEYNNKNFLTIKEYRAIAKKLIFKLGPTYGFGKTVTILRSEDALSNIITQIMIADWQWDGRGNLCGYRKQRVIWAVQNMMYRQRNKEYKYSLSWVSGDEQDEIGNLIEDKKKYLTVKDVEDKEFVNNILSLETLTDMQKNCLKLKYMKSMTLQEASDILNVTKEAVRKSIIQAKIKIRKRYNDEYTT